MISWDEDDDDAEEEVEEEEEEEDEEEDEEEEEGDDDKGWSDENEKDGDDVDEDDNGELDENCTKEIPDPDPRSSVIDWLFIIFHPNFPASIKISNRSHFILSNFPSFFAFFCASNHTPSRITIPKNRGKMRNIFKQDNSSINQLKERKGARGINF